MSTLNDLTLAQLTTAYGVIAGIAIKSKSFNSRAKAISRLEALLAEKGLTAADAWVALGLLIDDTAATATEPTAGDDNEADAAPEIEDDDETDTAPKATGACDADEEESTDLPDTASDPDENPATPAEAGTAAPDAPIGATGMPSFLVEPTARAAATKGFGEVLVYLGHSPADAQAAADWLERTIAHSLDTPTRRQARGSKATPKDDAAKPPRDGSKQQRVIALLRRPEGATIAQIMADTGWQAHTVRGALAGALKKRLGLTVTSTKEADGQRVYRV